MALLAPGEQVRRQRPDVLMHLLLDDGKNALVLGEW